MDAKRYELVFKIRDGIKNDAGVTACCEQMLQLDTQTPGDPAIQLNLGIALFENGQVPEAAAIFHTLTTDAKEVLPKIWLEKAVAYLGLVHLKSGAQEAIRSVLNGMILLPSENRRNLIGFIVQHLVDTSSIQFLLQTLNVNQWAGNVEPTEARRLFELASAAGIATLFDEFSNTVLGDMEEANLIRLLYYDISNLTWCIGLAKLCNGALDPAQAHKARSRHGASGSLRTALSFILPRKTAEVDAEIDLSQADAFQLGLQALSRLTFEEAEFLLLRLTVGGRHWHCLRLLGQLHEATGDTEVALDFYHRASLAELGSRQISTDAIRKVAVADAKVSCIVISYNDALLVPSFCRSIQPHCDEIILNDGGSTDGTIEAFEQFGRENGFPVLIIRDSQKRNRERSLATKNSYRKKGFGGVLGFEADRRRTTTLLAAQHPYILLADLDDYFPPFPNCKSLVASSFGIDHFVGSKCELLTAEEFCYIKQRPDAQLPTLFRRDRTHYFGGPARKDEYLARLDKSIDELASHYMPIHVSYCYNFWHLKYVLDPSFRDFVAPELGPRFAVNRRSDRPDQSFLRQLARSCVESRFEVKAVGTLGLDGRSFIKPVSPEDIVVSATDPSVGSLAGNREGGSIVATDCPSGYLAFGPRATLAAGNWIGGVHFDTGSDCAGSLIIDVCSDFGTTIHVRHDVDLNRMLEDERSVYLPFYLQHERHNVEVRVAINGAATVSVKYLSLSRTHL